jgi:hypothetical protein
VPVYQDRLCVMTKRAGRVPAVWVPLMIFPWQLWTALFFIYIVIAITWCILKCFTESSVSFIQTFIDASVLIFSAPFRRFPKVQSERILISSICLFSLIVVAAFQSSLSTVYTKPMYYKNIETLDELDKSGMKINSKYKSFLDDAFSVNSSDLMDRLAKKVVWIQNESIIQRIYKHKEAGLTRKIQYELSYKTKNLHLINDCPKKYQIAFVVRRNFYFLEEINDVFLRVSEAGIVRKIIRFVSFKTNLAYSMKNPETSTRKIFSLQDLQLGFYALLVGFGIASLTFLVENLRRLRQ